MALWAVVSVVVMIATSLALDSPQAADAADPPVPDRVPAGSVIVPMETRLFEQDRTKVDEFTGIEYGYCLTKVYWIIPAQYANPVDDFGRQITNFWHQHNYADPEPGGPTTYGSRYLFTDVPARVYFPAHVHDDYKPSEITYLYPGEEFAYYGDGNFQEVGSGRMDGADPESGCTAEARAERRERMLAEFSSVIWWSDGALPQPKLAATIARVPVSDEKIPVGEEFEVQATLTNTTDQPITNLALDGNGLFSNGEMTILEGPTWTAPTQLGPHQSVNVRWTVSFDSVGLQRVEVRAVAKHEGEATLGKGTWRAHIAPPIDVVVRSGQGATTEVGDEFPVDITITNEWDEGVFDVKMDALEGPSGGVIRVIDGPNEDDGFPPPAAGVEIAPGESTHITYRAVLQAPVFPAKLTARISGKDANVETIFFLTAESVEASGLDVTVAGERQGDLVVVTTKVKNVSGAPIDDLATSGLQIEPLADPEGGFLPLPLGEPDRDGRLPDTLGVGEETEITTRFDVVRDGSAVLTETVTGQGEAEPVSGEDVVSVEVEGGDVSVKQAEAAVQDGLRDALRTLDETNSLITEDLIGDLVDAGGTPTTPMAPELRANIDSWKSAGFTEEQATTLAVWEAEREHFDERMAATWTGFKQQAAARGVSAQKSGAAFLNTISDYDKVEMIVTDLWNGGIENLGYLGDVSSMSGPELMDVALPANKALAAKVGQDLELAYQGQKEIWKLEDGEFKANPSKASLTVGMRQGGYMANGVIDAGIGITTELAGVATNQLVGSLLRSQGMGLDVGMSASRIDPSDGLDGAADALGDPAARLARLEQANRNSLQNLPTGTVIDLDDLFGARTGMSPDDAAFFKEVAASMERDFPEVGDFVIQFRTAEPSTINLPNALGKEEWNAYKAVGALDEAIGGPKALRGQVGVFPPTPLSQDALDALEATNPGFTKGYAERFATQQKNWDEFNSGKGSVNTILAGSQRHGPVRIINGRPGHPTEGLTYLEQLDEPEFVAGLGMSEAEVAALRTRMESHPGLTEPIELLAQPLGDAVGFARKMPDGTIRPYGSDYDLQYFGPADGVWPPGKRGQIITEFMRRVGKNPRVPAHGASDLGFDLDSQYFKKLAEYIMLPVHPAAAAAKAEGLVKRAKQIARDLRLQADAIASTNPARAAAMRANADKLDAITVDEMKAFAKGEKTILITPGDIRVGGGG